jgi:hypothetical protein
VVSLAFTTLGNSCFEQTAYITSGDSFGFQLGRNGIFQKNHPPWEYR